MSEVFVDADPVVNQFVLSMPDGYREVFDRRSMREHALLVARRGDRPGHAAVWRTLPQGLSVVCVVADDHAGLLSVVTTVLVLHRLDVVTAQIFCRRRPDGALEAVDFFWVRQLDRPAHHPPSEDHLERCTHTITGFLRAGVAPEQVPSQRTFAPRVVAPPTMSWEPSASGDAALSVEVMDGPGLLMAMATALYQCQVSIVGSEIETQGGLARDRFVLRTRDLEPLDEPRRAEVETRMHAAILEWQARAALRHTA